MSGDRWERFCIVGFGGHARTKLLPAIEANGQALAGLVSRKPRTELPDVILFARVEDAIADLSADTCFIVASPPACHFAQALAITDAGRDVVVEKPAFVSAAEARTIAGRLAGTDAIFVEAFMHRHSLLYRRFLADFAASDAAELEIEFLIPNLPERTFRNDRSIAASLLYDIGCYVLSLVSDLGLAVEPLTIVGVDAAGSDAEQVRLEAKGDVHIRARVGVAPEYANVVTLRAPDGSVRRYSPFFYGRPGEREILGSSGAEKLTDNNAFQAMLDTPRVAWRSDQPQRLSQMIDATAQLEMLGQELEDIRAG